MNNEQTALIVDDSRSARFALRKMLEGRGYIVDTVESAQEAYAYLKRRRPSVVFLDHLMPGIDGFEALRSLRREPELDALPIVICSSNEGEAFAHEARARGAVNVLPKPPSHEYLSSILERVRLGSIPPPRVVSGSPKVQPIREPEVAIEQAVMKTLREALPEAGTLLPGMVEFAPAAFTQPMPLAEAANAEPVVDERVPADEVPAASMAATAPVPSPAAVVPTAVPAGVATVERFREEMESRLRKITQDLYLQMADVQAHLAHVEASIGHDDGEHLRSFAVEAARSAVDGLAQKVDLLGEELRSGLADAIEAQNRRFDILAQTMHQAAVEEAHAVSERVVMSAAARISDQIAESLLRVLRPGASAPFQGSNSATG